MRTRWIAVAIAVASATTWFVPVARADTSTLIATPTVEAWYQLDPTCKVPGCVGLGSLPTQPPAPPSPFPAGSMHVAVAAGTETARSYMSFSLPLGDSLLSGAALNVPLDVSAADGSQTPETAKIAVCTFLGTIEPANGSIEPPPTADCSRGVSAAYVAAPVPHLHAELGTMLDMLSAGAGLALLPDAHQVAQTDAWHVTFSAHDRSDSAKTPPASLSITTTTATATELPTFQGPDPVAPDGSVQQPQGLGFPPLATTVEVPPTDVPQPPALSPSVRPIRRAGRLTIGHSYPASIWLLPLGFLVLIPLVARTLMRDLTPVPEALPLS